MSRSKWRQLVVDGVDYEWFIPGNDIECGRTHVRVRVRDAVGQPLFIDPYHGFDIRPQRVADAIRWALANDWQPTRRARSKAPLILSTDERDRFVLLPEGVRFGPLNPWVPIDEPAPKRPRAVTRAASTPRIPPAARRRAQRS